jgi:hypothetical protein
MPQTTHEIAEGYIITLTTCRAMKPSNPWYTVIWLKKIGSRESEYDFSYVIEHEPQGRYSKRKLQKVHNRVVADLKAIEQKALKYLKEKE